jgi:hypothetical protein
MRTALLVGGGVALIAAGLADVFSAVLHYDHHGPLTSRLYRVVWGAVRFVARRLPRRGRRYVRSLGLPLMIVVTVVQWALLEITGFALLYLDGFARGGFTLGEGLAPTFRTAFYTSGVTLATLGYGDATPVRFPYDVLTFAEGLVGFAILTFTLSYLIGVYGVLQSINVIAASLHHQGDRADHVTAILAPHFPGGTPRELSTRLHDLHQGLLSYHEGLHRYPLVYYFCSDRPFQSMPETFLLLGEIIGGLRWGLPGGHAATCDPWLLALVRDYTEITAYVAERFPAPDDAEHPRTLPAPAFAREAGLDRPGDAGVRRFLHVTESMHRLVGLDPTAEGPAAQYERYRDWLAFARPASAFVRRASEDLAGDDGKLTGDHDRLLL